MHTRIRAAVMDEPIRVSSFNPIHRSMTRALLLLSIAITTLNACKEEEVLSPCLSSPAPWIDLNSWPDGLHPDSTWVVAYTDLPLDINVFADGSNRLLSAGTNATLTLTSVNIAIRSTANDSTLYALSQTPNSSYSVISNLATIGTITTDTPARLSISVGNSCSGSNSVVRKLLITP